MSVRLRVLTQIPLAVSRFVRKLELSSKFEHAVAPVHSGRRVVLVCGSVKVRHWVSPPLAPRPVSHRAATHDGVFESVMLSQRDAAWCSGRHLLVPAPPPPPPRHAMRPLPRARARADITPAHM